MYKFYHRVTKFLIHTFLLLCSFRKEKSSPSTASTNLLESNHSGRKRVAVTKPKSSSLTKSQVT